MYEENITKATKIKSILEEVFPDAHCELVYQNAYQLTLAVILSAQTTDKSVNIVTPMLFQKYPDLDALSQADVNDVMNLIKRIGLYKTKANNIVRFAQQVLERFNGVIPLEINQLVTLPGVGLKTANAVVAEVGDGFGFAVDTHVSRVSKRLGLALDTDNPTIIEQKLKQLFEKTTWRKTHHQMIFMGRYLCHAQKPKCDNCLLKKHELCQYSLK